MSKGSGEEWASAQAVARLGRSHRRSSRSNRSLAVENRGKAGTLCSFLRSYYPNVSNWVQKRRCQVTVRPFLYSVRQIRGPRTSNVRSDLWRLGVVNKRHFEQILGRMPVHHSGDNDVDILVPTLSPKSGR